jgi:hypothetical protein
MVSKISVHGFLSLLPSAKQSIMGEGHGGGNCSPHGGQEAEREREERKEGEGFPIYLSMAHPQ